MGMWVSSQIVLGVDILNLIDEEAEQKLKEVMKGSEVQDG